MSFLSELIRWSPGSSGAEIERQWTPGWQSYVDQWFQYQGQVYGPQGFSTTIPGQRTEAVIDSFTGYVQGAYKANGVVFSVSLARTLLFSDIRFRWRRLGQSGGGNDLFGNPELSLLERPWPGGTTQSLLTRAEQDVTNSGTFFVARDGDRLRRLRPDWCEFILSAAPDEAVASDVQAIMYTPGGRGGRGRPEFYLVNPGPGENPDGYATFWAPIPDPDAQFRGMSWLTPVMEEMRGDSAATAHKLKFFDNAATPNLAVSLSESVTVDQFKDFVRRMEEGHRGVENAYKTMYLGGGASVTPIGSTLQQMDFSGTQGHGETRVCAAGRVPPIIVGLSEGLSAATYSNYAQARRAFGDSWARPQWKSFAGAMEPLLVVPSGAELWFDTSDVAFLREDQKDLAETQSTIMATINAAIAGGFTSDSAVKAVLAEDLSLLVHSGLISVQLQAPGAQDKNTGPTPADEAAVFATQVGALVQLAGGPFDPESVITATESSDLGALVLSEPEPVPDPPAPEDPNAPLIDDAPVEESIRYSGGMDTEDATRHLPGQHNQHSHANRIGRPSNVPGKTGLSKVAGELADKPSLGPALPAKARNLGSYAARRDAVKEHAKLSRKKFDALPTDEQDKILDELRQAAKSGDQHTSNDGMGIATRGRAKHVTDAEYELGKFTRKIQPLSDNSPAGRLARAREADTAVAIRNALSGAKKADLVVMAREVGMTYSDSWKVDKFIDMIGQRILSTKKGQS